MGFSDWSKIPNDEVKKMISSQQRFEKQCKLYNFSWTKEQIKDICNDKGLQKGYNFTDFYKLTQKEYEELFVDSQPISDFQPRARVQVDY
jgi:hypothetical protein